MNKNQVLQFSLHECKEQFSRILHDTNRDPMAKETVNAEICNLPFWSHQG